MDLRAYYRKRREIEKGLSEEYLVVKSLATPDGGVAGQLAEVTRSLAAKMIADGAAEVAAGDEVETFRREAAERKKREDERRSAIEVQYRLISDSDARMLRRGGSKE